MRPSLSLLVAPHVMHKMGCLGTGATVWWEIVMELIGGQRARLMLLVVVLSLIRSIHVSCGLWSPHFQLVADFTQHF